MCGFAGIIDLKRLEINGDLDRRMSKALDSLHPRGPDQKGILKDEYSYLVHARLSIIDVTDNGKQPIHKYGKTIIYNGEIYNYEEVKEKLKKSGYNFFLTSS